MADPIIVVGLGNPGTSYENTRHNVGFLVVDEIAGRMRTLFRPGEGEYQHTSLRRDPHIVLVKPLTFMNNSGFAVLDVLRDFNATADRLLVVVDDLALPLGKLRLRTRGSDGGHNGLASIIMNLGTEDFARLRCGIGQDTPVPGATMAEFVLTPFGTVEQDRVAIMIQQAADTVLAFANTGTAGVAEEAND